MHFTCLSWRKTPIADFPFTCFKYDSLWIKIIRRTSPLMLALSDKHIRCIMKPQLTHVWVEQRRYKDTETGETKHSSHDPNKTGRATCKCTRNYEIFPALLDCVCCNAFSWSSDTLSKYELSHVKMSECEIWDENYTFQRVFLQHCLELMAPPFFTVWQTAMVCFLIFFQHQNNNSESLTYNTHIITFTRCIGSKCNRYISNIRKINSPPTKWFSTFKSKCAFLIQSECR